MAGPQVVTTAGKLEGTAHEGYLRFLGIPYAAPPVGALRFAPPAPPPPFATTFLAANFAPHAPQPDSTLEQALGEGATLVTSEADCLGLNVWTPACDDARRPVMFFVHGGSFLFGSSSSPIYGGAALAATHDVVVVSCNYRLGLLGFTHLDAFAGLPGRGSGNAGVLDVAAALSWVADNVERFGGDPDNVTAFGESAGAMAIGTLLGMEPGVRRFHKAILQSGASANVARAEEAAGHFEELRELLGEPENLEALRGLPVERLLEAQQLLTERHRRDRLVFRPVVDGDVLERPPLAAVADGAVRDVPLLIGTNLDEWRLFSASDPSAWSAEEHDLPARLERLTATDPGVVIATYRKRLGSGAPAKEVLDAVATDVTFRNPAIRLADAQVRAGGSAHVYLFSWASPAFGGALGSFHGLELPFVFGTLGTASGSLLTGGAAPAGLSEAIQQSWVAFARTGDPSSATVGEWPRYDERRRPTMVLDATCRVEDDPLRDERRLWAS